MKTKILAIVGVVVLATFAVAGLGCGGGDDVEASTSAGSTDGSQTTEVASKRDSKADKKQDDSDDEKTEEAVPVDVAELGRGEIESLLRFSSNLEAENQVEVVSEAKRLVRQLEVEEGDVVKKGQLLLRLQNDEQQSALTKVRSQLAKAEREYRRQKELREQELISQQAFADAIFDLEQLQIAVRDSERELSYTEVRAPIAGTITARMIKLGDQVQIGQKLFEIVDFDSIVARVFVPEKHLASLRPGLEARVSAAATGGRAYIGTVDRIAPVVDPQSGTIKVTIALGSQERLRPGLYVDVDLVTATHEDALLLPKRAVVYDNDQMFVYRLREDQRVERIFVEAVLANKEFVEPRDGLSAGDRIVVAGQAGLKDGALVKLPGEEERAPGGDAIQEVAQRTSR